jgi:XTP/dITP diphosphohydrolase
LGAPDGDALRGLVDVMDTLRSPGGCPWDAEQTHISLLPYLLEEAYETIEAVESGDRAGLQEELGDLLLQVVFHARIASEAPDGFDIDDVAAGIAAKLIRRHPHVFADAEVPADGDARWWQLKQAEKGRDSVTDGIPLALPALALATKLRHRSRAGGVALEPANKVAETAAAELLAALGNDADALGEALMALVVVADQRGWDAEAVARSAARGYRERLRAAESPR